MGNIFITAKQQATTVLKKSEGYKTAGAVAAYLLLKLVDLIWPDVIPDKSQETIVDIVEVLMTLGLLDKARQWYNNKKQK